MLRSMPERASIIVAATRQKSSVQTTKTRRHEDHEEREEEETRFFFLRVLASSSSLNDFMFFVSSWFVEYLNIKNLNRPIKAGDGILSGGGRVFVGDVAGEIQIGDGLGDEAIIQLLCLVDLMASGIASGM